MTVNRRIGVRAQAPGCSCTHELRRGRAKRWGLLPIARSRHQKPDSHEKHCTQHMRWSHRVMIAVGDTEAAYLAGGGTRRAGDTIIAPCDQSCPIARRTMLGAYRSGRRSGDCESITRTHNRLRKNRCDMDAQTPPAAGGLGLGLGTVEDIEMTNCGVNSHHPAA